MSIRRTTGLFFVLAAVSFAVASSILSATFDWPDILREPAPTVLSAFTAGGSSLVWTWFATAWTYALLAVPMLLLPGALWHPSRVEHVLPRRRSALRTVTLVGAASVLLSLIGFLRWVFVVPPLARSWTSGSPTTRAAVEAAWTAQHQFGGALLGEHLGQLLAIVWSVAVSVLALRGAVLPRWIGWTGLAASALYLLNQGDVMSTALPGFPVWDAAGLVGSTAWGLWIASLGVALLLPYAASSSSSPSSPSRRRAAGAGPAVALP